MNFVVFASPYLKPVPANLPSHFVTNHISGKRFEVLPSESVLDAAIRHGIALPYSCRTGTCTACTSKLIQGHVTLDEYDKSALTDEQLAAGEILLCRAHPTEDLIIEADEIEALSQIAIQKFPCRVASLERLTLDITKLSLRLPPDTMFNYRPGQYIDIILRHGKRRGFSIANAPFTSSELELHIREVPQGKFTHHILRSTRIRDILRIEGPLGTFILNRESELPVIMIAGGTGFAPLHAIIQQMINESNQRPVHLFWGVRTPKDFYLQEEIQDWASEQAKWLTYTPVISEPSEEGTWTGASGWVHETVLEHYDDLSGYEVYASGPPPMIEAIRLSFAEHELNNENFYFDSFEFSSDTLHGSQHSNSLTIQ